MSSRKFSPAHAASVQNVIPLDAIRVASPCNADWDAMTGDDRARFCGSCHKNVYDLSSMTRAQAEALILEKEGNLCVRYYQRADGTVLTQDCPIGLLQADRRVNGRIALASFFASLFVLCGALLSGVVAVPNSSAMAGEVVPAPKTQKNKSVVMGKPAVPAATPAPTPHPVMGLIACPPKSNPSGKKSAKSNKTAKQSKSTKRG